jgi:hypothetical protein
MKTAVEFIPYELALRMKQLGFDGPCFGVYFNPTQELFIGKKVNEYTEDVRTSAPLFQQAFRWFREKYNLLGNIYIVNFGSDEYCYNIYDLFEEKDIYDNFDGSSTSYMGTFENYEESEIACLEKLIEIVESSILKSK